jgi:hypothetical protein
MLRVSSGWTLLLKIFVPVFYSVFMLTWMIATIRAGDEVSPVFETWIYKIGIVVVFSITLLILRLTVWRLYRMDVSTDHIYITNYFKTFRYSLDSIESIHPESIFWFHFLKIKLKEKGSMGDAFTVLIEANVWEQWIMSNESYRMLIK